MLSDITASTHPSFANSHSFAMLPNLLLTPNSERVLLTPNSERVLLTPNSERVLLTPNSERVLLTPNHRDLLRRSSSRVSPYCRTPSCGPRSSMTSHSLPNFPSPVFCSSPTLAIPTLSTPADPNHLPSPIRHSEGDSRVVPVVRITGRKLFDTMGSEDEEEEEEEVGDCPPKKDKIGLLTFILDTEVSQTSASSTISSTGSPSFYSTYHSLPEDTRLINATQASLLHKYPHLGQDQKREAEVLTESCASLLNKYPNLFSSISQGADSSVVYSSNMSRDYHPYNLQDRRRTRKTDRDSNVVKKKPRIKSLFSAIFVRNKKNRAFKTSREGVMTSREGVMMSREGVMMSREGVMMSRDITTRNCSQRSRV